MSNFLQVNEEESNGRIDIDALFEKKQKKDLKQLSIFNKILNRIHNRIQLTGRTKPNEKHVFFSVPEFIFGEPLYNQGDCVGYLVVKLEDNGFNVRYIHPNTLFVSWKHWVPSYVRNEIKKKTGKIINAQGDIIGDKNTPKEEEEENSNDPNSQLFNKNQPQGKPGKEFRAIDQYKPSGNLVYNNDLFEKLEKKL
jgi:hypothetical protein